MVDTDGGNIWSFATNTASRYSVDSVHTTPFVSHPVYMGRYDFAGTRKYILTSRNNSIAVYKNRGYDAAASNNVLLWPNYSARFACATWFS